MKIGLTHNHNFALKILHSMTPQVNKPYDGFDYNSEVVIKQKDFIAIFRNDKISDEVIEKISEFVVSRRSMMREMERVMQVGIRNKLRQSTSRRSLMLVEDSVDTAVTEGDSKRGHPTIASMSHVDPHHVHNRASRHPPIRTDSLVSDPELAPLQTGHQTYGKSTDHSLSINQII